MSDYKAIDHLTIERGETFEYEFTIEVGGELLDLTGYNIYSHIRENQSRKSDLIYKFNVTVDDVATPNPAPTGSVVKLYLSQIETTKDIFYTHDEGFYDVLFVSPGGERTFYLAGKVFIEGSVSNET